MKIYLKTKFIDQQAIIVVHQFMDNSIRLDAVSLQGEPLMRLNVNMTKCEIPLHSDELILKNYSENEGLYNCLLRQNVVDPTGRSVELTYPTHKVKFPIVRLTDVALKELGLGKEESKEEAIPK